MSKFDTYMKELDSFIDHMEKQLDHAHNESLKKNYMPFNELYETTFTLTFRGTTLEIPFGAIEYNNLLECLENISKESKE